MHVLTVAAGATLSVAEDVTLRLKSAQFGSFKLPAGRRYSMAEVRALTSAEGVTLLGEGHLELSAESLSGTWTGWPDVGTASCALIPDQTVVEITDADREKVAALSEVKAGIGVRILCRTTQTPYVLKPAFSGDVTIEANGCGEIVLAGNNAGILSPGCFVFSNTTAIVSNRYGLGSSLTGPATFWPAQPFAEHCSVLAFGGPAVTNEVPLVFNYGAYLYHQDPSVRFVQTGNVTQNNGLTDKVVRRFRLANDVTLAAPAVMSIVPSGRCGV
jgi:hypothetical protein